MVTAKVSTIKIAICIVCMSPLKCSRLGMWQKTRIRGAPGLVPALNQSRIHMHINNRTNMLCACQRVCCNLHVTPYLDKREAYVLSFSRSPRVPLVHWE